MKVKSSIRKDKQAYAHSIPDPWPLVRQGNSFGSLSSTQVLLAALPNRFAGPRKVTLPHCETLFAHVLHFLDRTMLFLFLLCEPPFVADELHARPPASILCHVTQRRTDITPCIDVDTLRQVLADCRPVPSFSRSKSCCVFVELVCSTSLFT